MAMGWATRPQNKSIPAAKIANKMWEAVCSRSFDTTAKMITVLRNMVGTATIELKVITAATRFPYISSVSPFATRIQLQANNGILLFLVSLMKAKNCSSSSRQFEKTNKLQA